MLRHLIAAGVAALCAAASAQAAPDPAAPDPQRGEQIYTRCMACHALAYDRVGPHHCGLFGRRTGSAPGFNYSPAMKSSHIVWNAATLDRFLTNPLKMIPGTAMTYDGIADPQERADLIAYLKHIDQTPECKRLVPNKR